MLRLDFPKSPIPETGQLTPIRNLARLVEEGRVMRHCIGVYVEDVIEGSVYAYHWHGPPKATVLLCKTSDGGWRINEIQGIANRSLAERHRRQIEDAIESALADQGSVMGGNSSVPEDIWRLRALSRQFPAPPIDGDGRLVPLRTTEELLQEHHEMDLPIDNFWISSVQRKTAYFFQWRGAVRATVLVVLWGKSLIKGECLMREARPVPPLEASTIRQAVIEAFGKAGYEIECFDM